MTLSGPTSQSFISQRLRLNYVDWGNPDAPPLILQHGGRDHCRSWDWVAAELARDWHVIAPDLRGHGDSAWSPDGDYTMDGYIYDFAQLVHGLGYEQVTLVAHSLGGSVATQFTGLYPEKVAKLVNIEGLGPSPMLIAEYQKTSHAEHLRQKIANKRKAAGRTPRRYPSLEAAFARMKEENTFLTDEQARHLTVHGASRNEDGSWSWKFDPYLHLGGAGIIPYAEIEQLWAAITCPVLLLYGADSFASNPERDGRAKHFRNARVIEYANAGHWLHHDQFDQFIADVRQFLG